MKKAAIAIGSLILLISLCASALIGYTVLTRKKPAVTDRTNHNINVMLTRSDNWERIIDTPVIDVYDMCIIDGSTATIPITAEIYRQFWSFSDDQVNESDYVYHSTTHNAYSNLIDKRDGVLALWGVDDQPPISLIFVTPPSQEELDMAKTGDVTLDIEQIAKDGFVFIVNKDNPIDEITIEQIQDIYSGKITNWKEIGGKNQKIKAYQREENSGSQTAMEQMVMQDKQMQKPIETYIERSMSGLIEVVAAEYDNGNGSIGYTYNYYVNNLYKNDNIKVLKVNGVSPDDQNLISGDYPFTTGYFAVMRDDEAEDSPARKLRDFLLTEQGQQLIEMAGYCRGVTP